MPIELPVPLVVLLWGILAIAVITGVGRWSRATDPDRATGAGPGHRPAASAAPARGTVALVEDADDGTVRGS